MELVLVPLALLGHAFLWAAFFNHTHGSALPRWHMPPLTLIGFGLTVSIPVAFGLWLLNPGLEAAGGHWALAGGLGRLYLILSWIGGAAAIARWLRYRVFNSPPELLRHNRSRVVNLAEQSRGVHGFLARLPGNESLKLEITERALEIPRLDVALDRITILQLSDLHFSGRIGKPYFQEVVRLANQVQPDLVAVTGDLVDKPECIDWIPDTLGKLTSRWGVYFILGNHDRRGNTERLRRTLTDAGLINLGGRWMEIDIRGEPVLLAGNQQPWIPSTGDLQRGPPRSPGGPLRVALAHSPDQLAWARAHDVDLLLAGHTHGGQIRLPFIGPILSATRAGARYSSGTFHAPPTVMHVARGVSAEFPVRFHCPPEITRLQLQASLSATGRSGHA